MHRLSHLDLALFNIYSTICVFLTDAFNVNISKCTAEPLLILYSVASLIENYFDSPTETTVLHVFTSSIRMGTLESRILWPLPFFLLITLHIMTLY